MVKARARPVSMPFLLSSAAGKNETCSGRGSGARAWEWLTANLHRTPGLPRRRLHTHRKTYVPVDPTKTLSALVVSNIQVRPVCINSSQLYDTPTVGKLDRNLFTLEAGTLSVLSKA